MPGPCAQSDKFAGPWVTVEEEADFATLCSAEVRMSRRAGYDNPTALDCASALIRLCRLHVHGLSWVRKLDRNCGHPSIESVSDRDAG